MAHGRQGIWLRGPSMTVNADYGPIAGLGEIGPSPVQSDGAFGCCSASAVMTRAVPTKRKPRQGLVVGAQEDGTDGVCFVLMAVNPQMERVFSSVFSPVARAFGLKAEHADMLSSSTVVPEIMKRIHTAKIVLADVTHHRPNVYYEIGFAHKVNRHKVIIIGQGSYDELPSDIRQQSFRYTRYDDNTSGLSYLKRQLRDRFQSCLGNRRE